MALAPFSRASVLSILELKAVLGSNKTRGTETSLAADLLTTILGARGSGTSVALTQSDSKGISCLGQSAPWIVTAAGEFRDGQETLSCALMVTGTVRFVKRELTGFPKAVLAWTFGPLASGY